jgi:hypothetical protein
MNSLFLIRIDLTVVSTGEAIIKFKISRAERWATLGDFVDYNWNLSSLNTESHVLWLLNVILKASNCNSLEPMTRNQVTFSEERPWGGTGWDATIELDRLSPASTPRMHLESKHPTVFLL